MLQVYDLKTEYRKDPLGIDAPHPRFSWKLKSSRKNVLQTAYRLVARSDGKVIWDSGLVNEGESQRIRYEGEALKSRQKVVWQVEVRCGEETAHSEEASFEMGLLEPNDWIARWIEPEDEVDPDAFKPAPYLRRSFTVKPGLLKARIYQSAHGLYEFWINGKLGTEDKLKPGLTSYYYRTQYQSYDITRLLEEGENVWAVVLGDGWWRGTTGGLYTNNFGYKLHYIGQIELRYQDGSREIIGSDEQFKTATGGLRMSDMRMGDVFDAACEPDGWKRSGFDDSAWRQVHMAEDPHCDTTLLIPSRSLPVREIAHFEPTVTQSPDGGVLLDFGQNLAGYVRMKLRGCSKGQKVTLIYGEEQQDGDVYQGNVAFNGHEEHFQTVEYIARGDEIEEYAPMFAIFGFRYVGVKGYSLSQIQPGDFISCALSTDLEQTGSFSCSNSLISQLVSNSLWSQRSNFVDVPTDCPTRERSVWSGDAQIYCKTASDFMNVYPFYEKWMQDWNHEQFESGKLGSCCPSTNSLHNPQEVQRRIEKQLFAFIPPAVSGPLGDGAPVDGSAGWGDVSVLLPWRMYQCYGDSQILANQYESGKKWVDYMIRCAKQPNPLYAEQPQYRNETEGASDAEYIWDTGFHWGEWLEPDAGGASDGNFNPFEMMRTGSPLVATAYLAHSSGVLGDMAAVLGKDEDARFYHAYSEKVRQVYERYLIREDGFIQEGKQAPYVRALAFDLCGGEKREQVKDRLIHLVRGNGYRLNTGFLSTVFLLPVLADCGAVEEAYRVLEQEDCPGWLHSVKLGATTIPENWNGLDKKLDSYNHYSYGAVCDFMFTHVAGIRPDPEQPGYRRFFVKPLPGGSLQYAKAEYESLYGTIRASWEKRDGTLRVSVTVPVNTTAEIELPDGSSHDVGSGEWEYICD